MKASNKLCGIEITFEFKIEKLVEIFHIHEKAQKHFESFFELWSFVFIILLCLSFFCDKLILF